MIGAIDQGLISALVALGVFLTFRVLNFADLTVDGSFGAGTAMAAVLIVNGYSPVVATVAGALVGAAAGCVTGFLHTKAHIDPLLASILVMLAMYSVNSRIFWIGNNGEPRSSLSLLGLPTILRPLVQAFGRDTWVTVGAILAGVLVMIVIVNWFLNTEFGLAVMATGDNPAMASSLGISTDFAKIVTLAVSNGLVGLSGAVWTQYVGNAAIGDGTGWILIGLASVILGNALLGMRYMWLALIGVAFGAALYRVAIFWALKWDFLDNSDMKLITAALVVIALVASQSKWVRTVGARVSPWRKRRNVPEPLNAVPNPFSPFAEADASVTVGEEDEPVEVRP